MIYLDTHAIEILVDQKLRLFSKDARLAIARERDFRISPMALLELDYLREIGRTRVGGQESVAKLSTSISLRVCDLPFKDVAIQAAAESWTRDPFDRMIVAQARLAKAVLISRDSHILANYNKAIG